MVEKLLYPGDFIANVEEFLPGEGTYQDNGKIFSAEVGVVHKDFERRVVSIESKTNKIPMLQRSGLVAIGVIAKANDKVAFVDLLPFEDGKRRYIPVPASTVLRVNNIKRGFVKSLKNEFNVGDIVRVKILEADSQNVVVSTDGPNLGVIKAFCSNCRHPLDKEGKDLVCPQCGLKNHRHLANDYRKGKV